VIGVATTLTHNPLNGVTAGVWRDGDVVRKVLTQRREAPEGWKASTDPRHWNYWRREALVYETDLPGAIGIGAPRIDSVTELADGDVELRLEYVEGRHAKTMTIDDLEAAAGDLGRAQGASDLPRHDWLSRGFLRDYTQSRPTRWELLDDDEAWQLPLIREHFPPQVREGLVKLHRRRESLLRLMESLPRTLCHLDVWPNNLIRRPNGEVVFLDWAFVGDGAVGEDIGNLVPDSVFDLQLPHEALDELDVRLTAAYVRGLREAGWRGDERVVRLGICGSAVKYDWLTALSLERAETEEHVDYGHAGTVDPSARYAARAAGLALCARWADEAARLDQELR
jgi:hypothetical protein